jgi:hypothetical protein
VSPLTATIVGLLVLCLIAPELARWAQAAVPVLVSALFLLAIIRLASRPRRRR